MASRRETRERREKLAQELRATQRTGQLRAGEMVPPQRELADRYGLSMTIVGQELQKLVAEGVFYSLPRLGTFVGPRSELRNDGEREFYILFVDSTAANSVNETLGQIRLGFEDRITQLGGSVLLINEQQVKICRETGEFPQAAGAFEMAGSFGDDWPKVDPNLARACYGRAGEWRHRSDTLSFDDLDGGRQATRHLLSVGYKRLAYLGLHAENATEDDWPLWSQERQKGWESVLGEAGLDSTAVFLPSSSSPLGDWNQEEQLALSAAENLAVALKNGVRYEAVVAANDRVAGALLSHLESLQLPYECWPAIVGFDSQTALRSQLLTSLRLPWDELGRVAAQMLWDRRHGRLPAEPQHASIQMRLIARLSCRPEWSQENRFGALVAAP